METVVPLSTILPTENLAVVLDHPSTTPILSSTNPYPITVLPSQIAWYSEESPSSSSSSSLTTTDENINNHGPLSPEEIKLYETNGCLLVRNVFTPDELQRLQTYANEIQNWPRKDILNEPNAYTRHSETILITVPASSTPVDGTLIHTTGSSTLPNDANDSPLNSPSSSASSSSAVVRQRVICRVENFIPYHDSLAELVQTKVQPLVSQLFQEEAVLYKEKINYKLPGGGGYAPHYDGPSAAALNLASMFITAQIAIDDQTIETGCLYGVVPKASRTPPIMQEADKDGDPDITGRAGAIPPEIAATFPWQPLEAPAGSVLLFDHYFPHRSPPNRSTSIRRTGYFIYNAESEGDHHELYYYLMSEARRKYAMENYGSSNSSVISDHIS
jgi:hypothetical protein